MSDPVAGIPTVRILPARGNEPDAPSDGGGTDFGAMLRSAVGAMVDTGHAADAAAVKAVVTGGNLTEVATALARAEVTLQTATAVRDRMLQAYQDIMRIQI